MFGLSFTLEYCTMAITMTAGIGSVGNLPPTESLKRGPGLDRYRVMLTTTANYGTWKHHIVVLAENHAAANIKAKAQTRRLISGRFWTVETCDKISTTR